VSNRVAVRPIQTPDAPVIAAIHAASWRDAYRGLLRAEYLESEVAGDRIAVWTERLQHADAACYGFIAEQHGTPIGFVYLHGAHDPQWGTLLDNLHVRPGFTGRGIGRRLIESAAREAIRRHPAQRMYLWVFEQNVRARRFYARLGGRETECRLQPAPGGGALPECRVVWDDPSRLLQALELVP
jgi:GNAT superfamily N-acetyltransferase